MASVYKKGNKLYISYYDPSIGKSRNKSTGLKYSKENLKLAKRLANQFQDEFDKETAKLKELGIEKVTIQTAFDKFKKMNSDKHKNTLYEYDWFYDRFKQSFSPDSPCTVINKLSTEEWLAGIRELPYQRNTLHVYSKVFKKFLGFLFEYNFIPYFKINKNYAIRPEVKSVIIFSDADIKIFFSNLHKKNNNFRTIMNMLFYTGLRPSDIYNVKVEDIDLEKKLLRYYSQKTDEHFIVPLHLDLVPILQLRIEELTTGNLFDYADVKAIGKAFSRYIDDIGLSGKGYTLRTFRKTFISLAHDSGMELASVAKLVGHKDPSVTAKYYTKFGVTKQAAELNKINLKPKLEGDNDEK